MERENNNFYLVGKLYNIRSNQVYILVEENVFSVTVDTLLYEKILEYKDKIDTLGIQGYIDYDDNSNIALIGIKISFI